MRQFTLKNAIGEVYRLNSSDNFFHDPEGLGFQRDTTFKKIGSRYELLKDGFSQNPVRGSIMFKSTNTVSAYKSYLKFSHFLQEIPLTIVYRIPGGEFLMECIPGTIDKTEINSAFGMDVGIELIPISMWFNEIHRATSGGYTQDNVTWSVVSVNSDSLIESPCHIWASVPQGQTLTEVEWRYFHNPADTHGDDYDINGVLSDITLGSGDTLHIRTDTNPYRIYKTDSNGVETDLYAKSDFSTKRFINLQKGMNLVKFRGDFLSQGIEGRILHETV